MSMFDRVQELEAEVARGLENTPPAVNSPAAPLSARKAGMSAYQAAEAKRRKAVAAERERRQAEKLAAAEKAKERAEFVKATLKRSHEAKAKKRHNDLRFMEKLRKQAADEQAERARARYEERHALQADLKLQATAAAASESELRAKERSMQTKWERAMATKRAQAADARREAASGDRADVAAFKFAQHARARKSLAGKLDNWRAQRKQADVDRAAAATQAAEDRALDAGARADVAAFKSSQHARARKSLAGKLDKWRAQRKQAASARAAAEEAAAEDRSLDEQDREDVRLAEALNAEARRMSLAQRRIESERDRCVAHALDCDQKLQEEQDRAAAEIDDAAIAESMQKTRENARKSVAFRRVERERQAAVATAEAASARAREDEAREVADADRADVAAAHDAEARSRRESIQTRATALRRSKRLDEKKAAELEQAELEARALARLDREAQEEEERLRQLELDG